MNTTNRIPWLNDDDVQYDLAITCTKCGSRSDYTGRSPKSANVQVGTRTEVRDECYECRENWWKVSISNIRAIEKGKCAKCNVESYGNKCNNCGEDFIIKYSDIPWWFKCVKCKHTRKIMAPWNRWDIASCVMNTGQTCPKCENSTMGEYMGCGEDDGTLAAEPRRVTGMSIAEARRQMKSGHI